MSEVQAPGSGAFVQRLRLWSGLVLFTFASTHFVNHALGIHSIEWMEGFQDVRNLVWRSVPGTVLLYGSLMVHVLLGVWKIASRRTWRMPVWEAMLIAVAVTIPWQLITHIIGTRAAEELYNYNDSYSNVVRVLSPGLIVEQTFLMLAVWIHSIIGIHFWLRLRPFYNRISPALLCFAILVPALATWGWTLAAERLVVEGQEIERLSREAFRALDARVEFARWGSYSLISLAFLVPVVAWGFGLRTSKVAITYPGGQVFKAQPNATLLETSRANGFPHASVCGGRARCSTCRTLIIDGGDTLPEPSAEETKVLTRVNADNRVRLACQIRPKSPLTVHPLVPANGDAAPSQMTRDAYHWGVEKPVVIMFADLRNFTGLSEERLPYDTVFLLNRYLGLMREAIEDAGGQIDKFIGDGIMAIFGISADINTAARQSLDASARMAQALKQLNEELSTSVSSPLRMGVGLHLGPVILGRIGAAGRGQSDSITALGDTVNAASRLETASKDLGSFLVASRPVLKAASIKLEDDLFHPITVKGKKRPLDVAAVVEPGLLLGNHPENAVSKNEPRPVEAMTD